MARRVWIGMVVALAAGVAGSVPLAAPAPAAPSPGRIVFVAGEVPTPKGDAAMKALSRAVATAKGMDFVTMTDDTAASAVWDDTDIVHVSTSVNLAVLGDSLADAEVPVLTWEAFLFDDLGLASAVGEMAVSTRHVVIADAGSPLAAGLTGRPTVYTSAQKLSYAVLAPGGHKVATVPGFPTRSVIFEFETGDPLRDGSPAPSCRVGLFPGWVGGQSLTVAGRALVLAAMRHLTDCVAPVSDADGDGVADARDLCPGTASGAAVDPDGCSEAQRDDDGDGVANGSDLCPGTASGAAVDTDGCSEAQRDDDGDGVIGGSDLCPGTASGAAVDTNGCSEAQRDDDNDGVANGDDLCAATPSGSTVNDDGCRSFNVSFVNDIGFPMAAAITGQSPQNSGFSLSATLLPTQTYGPVLMVEGSYKITVVLTSVVFTISGDVTLYASTIGSAV